MRELERLRNINKDDLIGFSYGDYHSSQFGLLRVSNGNRYSEYLSPSLKNRTTDITGMDGSLYFGTSKTTLSFNVSIAFDSLNEAEVRDVKEWLCADGQPKPLIFDERPYVEYMCVINSAPQMSYLTFEENNDRIYKGEISVNFISYLPYGLSPKGKKFIENYHDKNFAEWSAASLIPSKEFFDATGAIATYEKFENGKIWLYNAGDYDADVVIRHYVQGGNTIITYGIGDESFSVKTPAQTVDSSGANAFLVESNSKLQLVRCTEVKWASGVATDVGKTPVILIPTSNFPFKLPRGRSQMIVSGGTTLSFKVDFRYKFA